MADDIENDQELIAEAKKIWREIKGMHGIGFVGTGRLEGVKTIFIYINIPMREMGVLGIRSKYKVSIQEMRGLGPVLKD